MKWAETLIEGARLFQGDVSADERHNVYAGENFSDGLVRNHAVFSPWILEGLDGARPSRDRQGSTGHPATRQKWLQLAVVFLPIDAVSLKMSAKLRNELFTRAV